MQQYPLIGISGNHRQDNTEHDTYILSSNLTDLLLDQKEQKAIPQ